jgi:hypothetical protein
MQSLLILVCILMIISSSVVGNGYIALQVLEVNWWRNLPSRRHLRRLDLSSLALTLFLYSRLALKFWWEVALFILIFPPLSCTHDQYLKVNRRVFNHAVSFTNTMLISSLLFILPWLVYFYILKMFLKFFLFVLN